MATRRLVERVALDDASWIDIGRGWLEGADELYADLAVGVPWAQGRLWRYERWVDEHRLGAPVSRVTGDGAAVLAATRRELVRRYRVDLGRGSMAWYRDGRDGMAFHRDRDLRYLDETVVAILSLGGPRPFVLRPRAAYWAGARPAGAERSVTLCSGDLLVMGGRCQADWEHSVPRQHRLGVPGRISAQWRWTSGRGRPEQGPSYRAPRTYRSSRLQG